MCVQGRNQEKHIHLYGLWSVVHRLQRTIKLKRMKKKTRKEIDKSSRGSSAYKQHIFTQFIIFKKNSFPKLEIAHWNLRWKWTKKMETNWKINNHANITQHRNQVTIFSFRMFIDYGQNRKHTKLWLSFIIIFILFLLRECGRFFAHFCLFHFNLKLSTTFAH